MKAVLFLLLLSVTVTFGLGQTPAKGGTKAATKKPAVPAPAPTPTEAVRFESANAISDPLERVALLKKFLADFPETDKRTTTSEIIVAARGDAANTYLSTGDPAKAANY